MSEKRIYCGKGRKQSDKWIKATINPEVLMQYVEEFEGVKFVRINIKIFEKVNQYGKDVSIEVDTWKPGQKKDEVEEIGF